MKKVEEKVSIHSIKCKNF